MGRSPKPLRITVDNAIIDWPEIQALKEQGHSIVSLEPNVSGDDVIIGPTCWLMDEQHRKYLDLAIKSARARRYPSKEKSE